MSSDEHTRLGEEYPRCDHIQIVIFIAFTTIWGLDSFVYHWTILGAFIPGTAKTIAGLILVTTGAYMVKEGHRLRPKPP